MWEKLRGLVRTSGTAVRRFAASRNVRLIVMAVLVVAVCASAPAMLAEPVIETGAWGLSFQKEGQTPVGTASASALSEYDAKYAGDDTEKVLYLTFDAGYESGCTGQILDALKKHDAPACFFLVGSYLERNPELVQRMTDEGHLIGNHTWHHWDMSRIADEAAFASELTAVEQKYTELTGKRMSNFYRPPQGVYSEENLRMAKKLGYRTVFWSLAYVDWQQENQPTKEQAFSKLLPRVHSGAVVLLHSTSATNAAILDELLTKWEDMGYRFGTLEELWNHSGTSA